MATVKLSPFGPKRQFIGDDGLPLIGYWLFFYVGGSVNTKQTTYTTSVGNVANPNPIQLNSLGEVPNEVYFVSGATYKVFLEPPDPANPSVPIDPPTSGQTLGDFLQGINDVTATIDQWIAGPAPTFINATQFTLVGDQTSTFQIGRRLKFTIAAGTVYGRITASVFAAVTTVTVVLDSGTLDSGLSAVFYGIISATDTSLPAIIQGGTGITVTYPGGNPTISLTSPQSQVAQGRITLVSGSPIVAAPNTSAATTVYWSPLGGNQIRLYDPVAGTWSVFPFTELSQATADTTKSPAALGASQNVDMFSWNDAGTIRCTRGPAWTVGGGSATARGVGAGSTELELFQGSYVNKNAITNGPTARAGLWVGSIQSNAGSTIDDTATVMGVWNLFNQVERVLRNTFSANRTTTSATYVEMNTEIRLTPLLGLAIAPVRIWTNGSYQNAAAAFKSAAAAIDSTTAAEPGFEVQDANGSTGGTNTLGISSEKTGLLGSHFITILGAINAGTLTMATATVVNTSAKVYLNASTPA